LFELFVLAGLTTSNGEARRLVRGGGATLNDARVDDETMLVDATSLRDGAVKLSAGKKRHVLVRPA
jgi:tyrosyl-tRNA synthetase